MKRSFLPMGLLLMSWALAFPAYSQEGFYLGVGGIVDMPTQNPEPGYSVGGGLQLLAGYCFEDNVSLQVQTDGFYYYGNSLSSILSLRPSLELKVAMDLEDFFQPYAFAGPGLDINVVSADGQDFTYIDGAAMAGLGVQFDLGDASLYAEGKYNYIFRPGSSTTGPIVQDIPLEAGLLFNL